MTIHTVAADIVDRIQGMQADSRTNNTETIESILKPVFEELTKLRRFAKNCHENFDCDEDAHKYGTPCRSCEASILLHP